MHLRISTIAFLLLLLFMCCSTKKDKSITLMTWNIWHGGLHGKEADNFKKDSSNTINVLKVLMEASPDVLFMQETYCCGMDLAKKAGYLYSWRASSNLSIHSKYPIADTFNLYNPFNAHGVIIEFENSKLLCVNIWLDYRPDYFNDFDKLSVDSMIVGESATRLKEMTAILQAVDSLDRKLNAPIIIGGDFNSGSHLDWVESTKEWHFGKVVEWPVSKLMEDNGYIDSFREANPDPTKTLEGTWGFLGEPESIMSDRIDFIYYKSSVLKTKNSRIIMDDPKDGFFNSDHRAVLTTFNWQ